MVLTCTGVSFSHGPNDGQKGMGLIMLILIGTVPTAYALNHAISPVEVQDFIAASEQAVHILDRHVDPKGTRGLDRAPRSPITFAPSKLATATVLAFAGLVDGLDHEVATTANTRRFRSRPDQCAQRHVRCQ